MFNQVLVLKQQKL